jgi:hypothetical protein
MEPQAWSGGDCTLTVAWLIWTANDTLVLACQETVLCGSSAGRMEWAGVRPYSCLEESCCSFVTKNQKKSTTRSAKSFMTMTREPSAHPPCPMLCSELLPLPARSTPSRDVVWRRSPAHSLPNRHKFPLVWLLTRTMQLVEGDVTVVVWLVLEI